MEEGDTWWDAAGYQMGDGQFSKTKRPSFAISGNSGSRRNSRKGSVNSDGSIKEVMNSSKISDFKLV